MVKRSLENAELPDSYGQHRYGVYIFSKNTDHLREDVESYFLQSRTLVNIVYTIIGRLSINYLKGRCLPSTELLGLII